MPNFLVIALTLVVISAVTVYSDQTLRQVNLVFRHGDRSPVAIFPTDPNRLDKWPQGLGWLSTIGMNQHYDLGQWLRKRYMDTFGYMSNSYKREEISVLSSDEDRCLMSAYSNLAGLYPPNPKGPQMWNPNITWQPIPVHTKPEAEDNMLNMGADCPRYTQLLAETMKSNAVRKEEKENKPFYEWLGSKTKWNHNNISNIWRIGDTLFCEKAHNMKLADWVNATVYSRLRKLEAYQFTLLYNGLEMSKLKGGPLLSQFIENMELKSRNATGVRTKMFMYSGHDTTVAALLSALELYDGKSPQYASCVIAELHENPAGHFYVNLFYKNKTESDTAFPLKLSNCSLNCSLPDFERLTKSAVPTDWPGECGIPSPSPSNGSHSVLSNAWIVSIILGGLLLVVLILSAVYFFKRKRDNKNVLYDKFDVST